MKTNFVRFFAPVVVAACFAAGGARAQCRTTTTSGAAAFTQVTGLPLVGTALGSAAASDGTRFQVANVGGLLTGPSVRRMFCTMNENASDQGPVFYAIVFSNPTAASITVTQVNFTTASGQNIFAANPANTTPATGWTRPSNSQTNVRWTGSIAVAANTAQEFIFSATNISTNGDVTYTMSTSVTTSAGTFTGTPFDIDMPGSQLPYAASTVVGFDLVGGGTYAPDIYVATGVGPATVMNLPIRVRETSSSGDARNGIETGLQLTVTIPAGWSSVSVPTATTPWSAASVVVTQPTLFADGQVRVTTSADIARGASTPAGSLVLRATTPPASFTTSLFPFNMSLNGRSQDTAILAPINGINESVVRVVNLSTVGITAELVSPALGPAPVRQIAFQTDFNMTNGVAGDSVTVQAFNNTSSAFDTIGSATVTAANATVTRTFTSDFEPYLNGSNQMRIRFVSAGTTTRILGVDLLRWVVTTGFTVDNSTGNDTFSGNVAHPYKTISKALSVIGASGAAYVQVGSSQTGTPYAANNVFAAAVSGTASCSTFVQGVPTGTTLPLVRGTDPANDAGFDVQANFVTVDGFQISNAQVGLISEPGKTGTQFSNNLVLAGNLGYGIILNTTSNAVVSGNRAAPGSGGASFFGIWDYQGTNNRIDGNVVAGQGEGITSHYSTGLIVQRNISAGNPFGIHISNAAGPITLSNNTVNQSGFLGIYVEQNQVGATVTSRDNIVANGRYGWAWDGVRTMPSSNFDDVFGNTSNYAYTVPVTAGANSISANPNFVQTTDPTLATYYQLNAGSACLTAGTDLGLGLGTHIGAK